jgi:hypothetical protein
MNRQRRLSDGTKRKRVWAITSHLSPTVVVLASLLLLTGCAPSTATPVDDLSVTFEQAGGGVPLLDGVVQLRRAPFTVVVTMPLLGGVMVNASPSARLYDTVAAGGTAGSVLPIPARGIPENLLNPQQALYVTDTDYNYWYYLGPAVHRFSDVREVEGRFVCRRNIAGFAPDSSSPLRPIGDYPGDALHMVFVEVKLSGHQRVERKATAIMAQFR